MYSLDCSVIHTWVSPPLQTNLTCKVTHLKMIKNPCDFRSFLHLSFLTKHLYFLFVFSLKLKLACSVKEQLNTYQSKDLDTFYHFWLVLYITLRSCFTSHRISHSKHYNKDGIINKYKISPILITIQYNTQTYFHARQSALNPSPPPLFASVTTLWITTLSVFSFCLILNILPASLSLSGVPVGSN